MFDKYDRFNLNINTNATGATVANWSTSSSTDDRCNYISIAGLPWVSNTYSQKTNYNTTSTTIASCYFNPGTQTTQYCHSKNTVTFNRNQVVCNFFYIFYKLQTA